MRVLEFDLTEVCGICGEDLASVYAVMRRGVFTHKAHVCFRCFGELEECGNQWVDAVSPDEFEQTKETPVFLG